MILKPDSINIAKNQRLQIEIKNCLTKLKNMVKDLLLTINISIVKMIDSY